MSCSQRAPHWEAAVQFSPLSQSLRLGKRIGRQAIGGLVGDSDADCCIALLHCFVALRRWQISNSKQFYVSQNLIFNFFELSNHLKNLRIEASCVPRAFRISSFSNRCANKCPPVNKTILVQKVEHFQNSQELCTSLAVKDFEANFPEYLNFQRFQSRIAQLIDI